MALIVKITATVIIGKHCGPPEWFEGDVSLAVASAILTSDLPKGVVWGERTAQIVGFTNDEPEAKGA